MIRASREVFITTAVLARPRIRKDAPREKQRAERKESQNRARRWSRVSAFCFLFLFLNATRSRLTFPSAIVCDINIYARRGKIHVVARGKR